MTGDKGDRRTLAHTGESPYEGTLGRTRTEVVQVWMPDDSVRALPVYVGVDAVKDPGLATLARSGMLHHVGEGVDLAVPFVYHDPTKRLFLLVVPDVLRHRALALRAEHMALVAADTEHPVPAYVRDVDVVIGRGGLEARLLGGRSSGPAFGPTEATGVLLERIRELSRREHLLRAREGALRAESTAAQPLDPFDEDDADGYDDTGDEADDDELEEVEDLEDEAVLSADEDASEYDADADPDGPMTAVVVDDGEVLDMSDTSPAVPDWFLHDDGATVCLTASGGRVWLLVRGVDSWAGTDMDLLVQLARDTVVPVVLLAFACGSGGSGEILRGVVDPDDPVQRAALEALGEHFELEVLALTEDGVFTAMATLTAPREHNVRAILALLAENPAPDRALWEVARNHALSSPLPLDDRQHPFRPGPREAPRTATEAAVALDAVAEWLTPERRRLLLVSLCVPDDLIDEHVRDVVAFALDWGLSVPKHLATRALELGLEKDEAGLLMRRIEGLCRAAAAPDSGGLEESVLRAMWSEALEQAARLGVALSDAAHDQAQKHAGERAQIHAAALSDPHDQALEPLRARALRGEQVDVEALVELAARGAYRDLLAVCRVTEQLEPDPAARVFAHVARRHDPVALDALLSLLTTGEPVRVRLGAALALASRHAVTAIDELAQHVAREGEPEWTLFALALGRYGAGSFRAISRALAHEGANEARMVEVQAHLALHGARAQVRAKTRLHQGKEASLATRVLSRASELREGKNSPLGLEQQGPLTVFCTGFDRFLRDVQS